VRSHLSHPYTTTGKIIRDFRLPLRSRWELRSSGLLPLLAA
jgi:hypothetical protein